MEGLLLKWTNYMSGWQQRWFAITDGTLSYYRAKEEMSSGCKGSVKLAMCDVIEGQNQAIANNQSELRLYHKLVVQQVKQLQGQMMEDKIPDMKQVNEITGTLNAACSTFLSTLDELLALTQTPNQPTQTPKVPRSNAMDMNRYSSNGTISPTLSISNLSSSLGSGKGKSLVSQSIVPLRTGGGLYSWFPDNHLSSSVRSGINLTVGGSPRGCQQRMSQGHRTHQTFFSTLEYSFEDLRPNLEITPNIDPGQSMPGDYLSALDFSRACRAVFDIFHRFPHATNSAGPLDQVHADLQSNLDRLELAIQVYAIGRSASPEDDAVFSNSPHTTTVVRNGARSPTGKRQRTLFHQATCSIGGILREDVAQRRCEDPASAYLSVLWLARSLNFARELIHLLFTLPPPFEDDDEIDGPVHPGATSNVDDSLSVVVTEAYSRCLRSFHPWSLRGVAMIVIKQLPSRAQLLHILLADSLRPPSPLVKGDNHQAATIHTDWLTQPELYRQLEKDAKQYADALGRTLTLVEALMATLDLERIFTGSETY